MYIIDSKPVDLDSMSEDDLNVTLQKVHTANGKIYCCCSGRAISEYSPLSLHVRQRGTIFSLVKNASTGPSHFRNCRHRSLTKVDAAKLGYAEGVLATDTEDRTVIRLNFSLKNAESTTLEPKGSFTFNGASRAKDVYPQASMLGLLHLFWERAGLHRFRPGTSSSVVEKLGSIKAAAKYVRLARMAQAEYGLEEHLLLPCVGSDTLQTAQRKVNSAKLRSAHEKKKKVLFIAVAGGSSGLRISFDEKNRLTFRDQLQANIRTTGSETLESLLTVRFPVATSAYNRGDTVVMLGVAKTHRYQNYLRAELEDLVAMPVTSDWIPYQSSHEKALADVLAKLGRSFEKPLTYDNKEPVFPDFVLEDCPDGKHLLEVYGVAGRDDYELRRTEKREIYASDYRGRYWEWDAVAEKDIAKWLVQNPLPAAKAWR